MAHLCVLVFPKLPQAACAASPLKEGALKPPSLREVARISVTEGVEPLDAFKTIPKGE